MRRVKGGDTTPEMAFRTALWRRGLRYRVHDARLPGKPDLVLLKARLAVFIDGDYWHGNQWRRRGHGSLEEQFAKAQARDYWVAKISRNTARDEANTRQLVADDWRVLRFWESQIAADLQSCVDMAVRAATTGDLTGSLPGLPEKTVAEFFAGIGLVRVALARQGWEVTFANDIDPQKYEIYATNFADDPPEQYRVEDIHKLGPDDVPTVTLATASFPCTDLSLAGARNGLAGKQSGALLGFFEILCEMGERRPPIVMLENVPGFLSSHGGEDFRFALRTLNDLGYAVDAFMLDAARFTPQSRKRMFVIGCRGGAGGDPEGGLIAESPVRPKRLADAIRAESQIRWRVARLPVPPERDGVLRDVVEDVPEDSAIWWSEERVDYLLSQMSEKHGRVVEEMLASQELRYGTVFRRMRHGRSMAELRSDGIAGCLRTPRGGSSRQILLRAGRGECRARFLTPRECARLQGAPESYYVEGFPLNQALFGLGDAVCVPVIEWIAQHYLNAALAQLLRGRVLSRD